MPRRERETCDSKSNCVREFSLSLHIYTLFFGSFAAIYENQEPQGVHRSLLFYNSLFDSRQRDPSCNEQKKTQQPPDPLSKSSVRVCMSFSFCSFFFFYFKITRYKNKKKRNCYGSILMQTVANDEAERGYEVPLFFPPPAMKN